MKLPEKIPIRRMEDLHTRYAGRCSDGRQFWGYYTFVFPDSWDEWKGSNWQSVRREYVLLHTFDKNGSYLTTNYYFAGTTDQADHQLMLNKLKDWIGQLGEVTFTDIEVKLFQTTIDNSLFGLVPDYDGRSIELQPGSTISFIEPWDGEYYT